ncbi:MAG TPA: metallophosphoesterase [Amycolatopsis sp.]|uniref:metallophosphoesterase n=1 Tax=Amycolatopsis sp. TaxID=37632 RepID=UPI002B4A9721|nr:metallophosphoesterase [Amycolatopsis sp.]HKS44844.1 metallophosphoesterase [Amycolatopsis sp.]
MRRWHRRALAVVAAGALTGAAVEVGPAAASAPTGEDGYTFAVIGDIPYGDAQIAAFPKVVAQINADPAVQWVDHLGDIKSGSTVCSDEYFQLIKADFDQFADPLVYTVGDNEWTDCHRPNNGGYNPLERLAKIRQVFFPQPGHTLGRQGARVLSQAGQGIPEDVRWERAGVAFAALHIVGSDNSLAPWTGNTAPTPEQTAEVLGRTAAVIQEIHETFAGARARHAKAVALLTQADMFDPTVPSPKFADYYGFQPIVAAIARESADFGGPVYLFNGDSHVYNSDNPLAAGSKWLSLYGIGQPVPNLSRITVDGSTTVNNYLRVTVHQHGPQVLTWTRVPFTS